MASDIAIAARALPLVDLTNLEEGCNEADIDALTEAAETPHGAVAAVCIWPRFVARARENLKGTAVRIATVVNFPGGDEDEDTVVAAARQAAFDGAHEIDLVLPYRRFAEGDQDRAVAMVSAVKAALPEGVDLKVILETGELKTPELIRIASVKTIAAGADFLKTSTGKVPVNATPEAAQIMLDAIHEHNRAVGFKAAGGIRTVEDAGIYLAIADRVMGPDWVSSKTFRFGASSLLGALTAALEGRTAEAAEGY